MQMVTMEDLERLAGERPLGEGEDLGAGLSFREVGRAYTGKKMAAERELGPRFAKEWPAFMARWMKTEYLPGKCPPIALVGEGSSRVAYACLGGRCLKVASCEAGVAQNGHEEKLARRRWWRRGRPCFAQVYGASPDMGLLLTECCAPATEESLAAAFGLPSFDAFRAVVKAVAVSGGKGLKATSDELARTAGDLERKARSFRALEKFAEAARAAAAWAGKMAKAGPSAMSPGQRSFAALAAFWSEEGLDELMPGDAADASNWGFAVRDGEIAPVMLDAGFSNAVARRYYRG